MSVFYNVSKIQCKQDLFFWLHSIFPILIFAFFFFFKNKIIMFVGRAFPMENPKGQFSYSVCIKMFYNFAFIRAPFMLSFFFFFFNNSIDTIREGDLNFELKKLLLQTPWNISWAIKLINLYNAWIFFFFFFWRGEWPH